MSGEGSIPLDNRPLKDLTVGQAKQLFSEVVKNLAEFKQENEMAKNPNEGGINRHKKMAMGEKIELKKGGMPKKEKDKAKKK